MLARVVKAFDLRLGEDQPARPPELIGATALDGEQILRLLGVDCEIKDAQPNSNRWVVNAENWVVVSQNLDSTCRRPLVTLRVLRVGEGASRPSR